MPIRSRNDMHIGIDLALEVLNSRPTNRLDPAIKDYFLNKTIAEFVNIAIVKANQIDDNRIPLGSITFANILSKYNDIHTLVKVDDTVIPVLPLTDDKSYSYVLPSDLFKFETSYSHVRPLDTIQTGTTASVNTAATAPTLAAGVAGATVTAGTHYYFVKFVYPTGESDVVGTSVASITLTVAGAVSLSVIPLGVTGCTARKVYRTIVGDPWYKARLVTTISDNTTQIYSDVAPDASIASAALGFANIYDITLSNALLNTYDVIAFNNNPFGGKQKLDRLYKYTTKYSATTSTVAEFIELGTIIESGTSLNTSKLRLYHNSLYAISKVGIIYIKKPAILSESVIQCDLPEAIHDKIVDDTAKFISATTSNTNYQALLNEAKLKE